MKYLLLICTDDSVTIDNPAELDAQAWVDEMDGRGARLMGDRVRPAEDVTTVRVREGSLLLTDGPFADSKEHMAGFDVIECADLDEAVEIASKHPMARFGMVEVWPFWTE
ncbi:YciI family protein [Streptomyces sp. NPDC087420]|uniref:YciI family protein n=1 Tax=Streptomyces sp. NPDC087420 TaxID=3365785 RepID=UPI003833CF16